MMKRLIPILQLVFGVGLVWYILHDLKNKGQLADMRTALVSAGGNWPYLAAAVACFGICLLLCAIRWKLLLDAQQARLGFGRIFNLFFIGQFFNAFIPGATGGDVVKAYYVGRQSRANRAEVVATVFIDRLIGLFSIVALAAIVALVRVRFFLDHRELRFALAFTAILTLATIAGLVVIFGQNLFERWSFFRRLEERTALGRITSRVYQAFHMCLRSRALLVQTSVLSMANHLTFILCTYCLSRAIGIAMQFTGYLTVFPVINMVAAIPVTPSGLGTRDVAAKKLLAIYGVQESSAVTLTLLIYTVMMLWSLFGGIIYFIFSLRGETVRPGGDTTGDGSARA